MKEAIFKVNFWCRGEKDTIKGFLDWLESLDTNQIKIINFHKKYIANIKDVSASKKDLLQKVKQMEKKKK